MVQIEGFEMPRSCKLCKLAHWESFNIHGTDDRLICPFRGDEDVDNVKYGYRHPGCPLKEDE